VVVARLWWPYVAREGEDSRGSTGGGERGGATRGGRRRAAGRRTRPGRGGGVQQRRNREEIGIGEDEGDLVVKSRKFRGLHCKAWTIFIPMLKWRWTQKQKCRVFQALQLCFRVHLQKSHSFEISIKLSKIFKLYVNPIDKTTLHIYPKGSFTYFCDLNTGFGLLQNNPHTFEFYPPCSLI
jgi:hypothetical protein